MMTKICHAIASSTGAQCKKRTIPGSKYCLFHIEKAPIFWGALIGALLSLIATEFWHNTFPSKELKALRLEAASRKEAENLAKERVEKLNSQLKAVEDSLSKQREEMLTQLTLVQNQLEPFVELAKFRYPNYELPAALNKLRYELEEVKELASMDIPRDPNDVVIKNTVSALNEWRNKNSDILLRFNLENSHINPHSESVVNVIIKFIEISGIKKELGSRSYISFVKRKAPITVLTTPQLIHSAKQLIGALSNYVKCQTDYTEKSDFDAKTIELTFSGAPKFL